MQVRHESYNFTVFATSFDPIAGEPQLYEYCTAEKMRLQGCSIPGSHLRWVRMTGATFLDCDFRDTTWECVFADFALFERCCFDVAHIFESVFAGSRFIDCTFTGATADMCNFNAIVARNTDFSDASLRRSRFLNARLTGVAFVNCDLKDTFFQFSQREDVSFKHSNYEEACY